MVGHFSTPITPESGSFLHADSQLCCKSDEEVLVVWERSSSSYGCDIGVPRFVCRPAMLEAPSLNLS